MNLILIAGSMHYGPAVSSAVKAPEGAHIQYVTGVSESHTKLMDHWSEYGLIVIDGRMEGARDFLSMIRQQRAPKDLPAIIIDAGGWKQDEDAVVVAADDSDALTRAITKLYRH